MAKEGLTGLIGGNIISQGSPSPGQMKIEDLDPNLRIELYIRDVNTAIVTGDTETAQKYLDMIGTANNDSVVLSDRDTLTGIMKRATFERDFATAYSMLKREGVPFAVMIADVDNFKGVNDTYGHLAGDAVLKGVAARMSEGIRNVDGVYRYAGDEFAGIYSGVDNDGAILVANRAVKRVNGSSIYIGDGKGVNTSISAGIVVVGEGDSYDAAVEKADKALYRAKEAGRNQASL